MVHLKQKWLPTVPEEVGAAMAPHIDQWAYLLPGWCAELIIDWDRNPENPEASLQMEPRPEYRWTRLTIYPAWFDQSPASRQLDVIHEMVHALIGPLQQVADDLVPTGPARKPWKNQVHDAVEGVTCDIAQALLTTAGRTDGQS